MASVKELLLATLEELLEKEIRTFQWFLYSDVLEEFEHIPKARAHGLNREDTVDVVVQTYGYEDAVTVTVDILMKMKHKLLADKLKEKYNEGKVSFKITKLDFLVGL